MQPFIQRIRTIISLITTRTATGWRRFRSLKPWAQTLVWALLAVLLISGITYARSGKTVQEAPRDRVVTIAPIAALAGSGDGSSILGTVRSLTQADLLAETGGIVQRVNTRIGATVPAGFVVAELDNSSEAAAVLQVQGVYDAAIAGRNAQSLPDTQSSARNAYRSAYAATSAAIDVQADTFFGAPTVTGPRLLINTNSTDDTNRLSRERARLQGVIATFQANQATAAGRSPEALLGEAESVATQVQTFLNDLASVANRRNSNATPDQIAALEAARGSINGTLASITAARAQLRSGSVSATAGADASIKQALGALRAAQANFEKTRIRATIGGTVNFLPVTVGQYVAAFTRVATVAQNGALEIVAYISEDGRDRLTVGDTVAIEGGATGVVTAIAPALDPVTKQIEIRIAVTGDRTLTNGQSVRITLPGAPVDVTEQRGPLLLPLPTVKLQADTRVVFTVDGDGRLAAYPVEIGTVIGDRIQVTSAIPTDLRIVTDARGLSVGQRVTVATSTTP